MPEIVEIKECPVCDGMKFICIGIKDNLEPILQPCTGCDGTGWLIYGEKNDKTSSSMVLS